MAQPASAGRTRRGARSSLRSHPFARASGVGGCPGRRDERSESAQPLALGRRALERPGQRERAGAASSSAPRRPPARANAPRPRTGRLARRAVVGRRLAHEVDARGSRACTRCRRGSARARPDRAARAARRACADRCSAPRLVVEKRRSLRAPRKASLLQPEDEDDLVPARAGAHEVEDVRRGRARSAAEPRTVGPLEGARISSRETCSPRRSQSLELVQEARARPRTRAGRAARARRAAARSDRRRRAASTRASVRAAASGSLRARPGRGSGSASRGA